MGQGAVLGAWFRMGPAMGSDAQAEQTPGQAHPIVRQRHARQCGGERQEAALSAQEFPASRQARLPRPLVPRSLGGMGENHVAAAMAVETIARYGCPSTAMCYTMHLGAVAAALFRCHKSRPIRDIMKRIAKDCLVGTLSYSDPETGSHFWYPISSGAEEVEE